MDDSALELDTWDASVDEKRSTRRDSQATVTIASHLGKQWSQCRRTVTCRTHTPSTSPHGDVSLFVSPLLSVAMSQGLRGVLSPWVLKFDD